MKAFVIAGGAILAAIIAAVLLIHGTDNEGLRAAIRATARTSALCAGLAFARLRVREFSALAGFVRWVRGTGVHPTAARDPSPRS